MDDLEFYIGTSLSNAEQARDLHNLLEENGAENLYPWFHHPPVPHDDASALRGRAQAEVLACHNADFVVIILPSGRGTHAELGVALGSGVKVFLWVPEDGVLESRSLLNGSCGYPCVFHYHELVEVIVDPDASAVLTAVATWHEIKPWSE